MLAKPNQSLAKPQPRIKIDIKDGDKNRVNISIPLSLVKQCAKFIPNHIFNLESLLEQMPQRADLIDLETEEKNKKQRVKISIS